MAGLSLAKALKQPDCLGGPWKVYGAARRSADGWFPSSILDGFITFDAVNSADTHTKLLPISQEVTHLFWVTSFANRHLGLPFRYPGNRYTWEHFCDMTDVGVLAKQHVWAAVTEDAKNQAFNCTNGDVFTWKSMWMLLSEVFDVKFVELNDKEGFDLVELMRDKGEIWDLIVEEYGLHKTKLQEIASFEATVPVLRFQFQHVSSMNKSIRFWVAKLREMKLIPVYQH